MENERSAHPVGLDHVGIDVRDLAAEIAFYREGFDLEVEWKQELPEYNFTLCFLLSPSGWRLELFHRHGSVPGERRDPDTQHDVLGLGHIAFACGSADDLTLIHDRLVGLGAASYMPPMPSPVPSKLMAYLADPEGNLIELVERS